MNVDGNLVPWSDLDLGVARPTLLLGDGASINLWQRFCYPSLYEAAAPEFSTLTRTLFEQMGTRNFEEVLTGLATTRMFTTAAGHEVDWIDSTYEAIRDNLFKAVSRVHVPKYALPPGTLPTIGRHLLDYAAVFTLNYDLLLYWAMQTEGVQSRVADFFFQGQAFNPLDTGIWSNRTPIYHLHGGLHLWRDTQSGKCGKWTAAQSNLLANLRTCYKAEGSRQPLFVTEGSASAKLRSIQRSDYLSFAYARLAADNQPTVVFGASLGSADDHIVKALAKGSPRTIAISLCPEAGTGTAVVELKLQLMNQLHGHKVLFFNSTSHPLGTAQLRPADSDQAAS